MRPGGIEGFKEEEEDGVNDRVVEAAAVLSVTRREMHVNLRRATTLTPPFAAATPPPAVGKQFSAQ